MSSYAFFDIKLNLCVDAFVGIFILFTSGALGQLKADARNFNTNYCAAISERDYCNCTYNAYDSILIYCRNADDTARVHIKVQDIDVIEINCEGRRIGVGCNVTHPCIPQDLLQRLPRLWTIRKASFTGIRYCLPFTEMLLQLGLSESDSLQVHGLEFISVLEQRHFGTNLSYLQNVSILELLAQSTQNLVGRQGLILAEQLAANALPATQQLDALILRPFAQLRCLTIFMNFAQLPFEIFTPVAHTLGELHLYGALRNFPRHTLSVLSNLNILTMSGHQLEARLHEHDFFALRALKELSLQRCNISALPAHIFAPLTALERLTIRQNNLRTLPSALLAHQRNLLILNLIDNQLEILPAGLLAGTSNLQELILTYNRLSQLSADLLPPNNTLINLYVDYNELRSIEVGTFKHARHLRNLLLGYNKLDWSRAESCAILEGLNGVEVLGLQNNSLQYLCDELGAHLPKLQILSVPQNKLSHLSAQLLRTLNASATLRAVYLEKNPWLCDCGAQSLHTFVRGNRMRFAEMSEVACNDTHLMPLVQLAYNDFCPPDLGVDALLVLTFTSISAFILLLLTLTLCYYKYNVQLKICLYARGLCLCCISEVELDRERKYDAFISYTHEDEHFVEHELVPGLEEGTPAFKICIHVRDWLVGGFIAEQIIDSVEQSRRTIIVLSQHFMQSDWALMEFRMAHQRALNEGRSRIILVVYGDLVNTEQLDQELRAYLKMNTYLKWGEPWFWEKLRYAMPHSRRVWERAQHAEERMNDVPLHVLSARV